MNFKIGDRVRLNTIDAEDMQLGIKSCWRIGYISEIIIRGYKYLVRFDTYHGYVQQIYSASRLILVERPEISEKPNLEKTEKTNNNQPKIVEVKTQCEIEEWAKIIRDKFEKDDNVGAWSNKGITIVIDWTNGNTAKSKCHSEDKFDSRIGIAYAYARLMGYPEPKLVEEKKKITVAECVGKTVLINNQEYHVLGRIKGSYDYVLQNKALEFSLFKEHYIIDKIVDKIY